MSHPRLRLVPPDPDPLEFPPRRFACLDRFSPATSRCHDCTATVCPYEYDQAPPPPGRMA